MDADTVERRQPSLFIFNKAFIDHTDDGQVNNNVRAPKENDANYFIWNALNQLHEIGAEPTIKTAVRLAHELKVDENSTVVTFLQWKKFHEQSA